MGLCQNNFRGASWIGPLVLLAALLTLARPASISAAAVRRLYIEPLTTKAGAERLREDLMAELRKDASLSVVTNASEADLILGGGGEVWIKAYRSLNPRSGRLPSDGTPVYAGYFSVELRDPKGETLWSDLVTPGEVSVDISKELSKRIAKHLTAALEKVELPADVTTLPAAQAVLKGAGATFPYPVYAKWFTNYRRENPAVEIAYDPAGSEAGVRRLLNGEVDFGASDNPNVIHDLAAAEEGKYLFLPSVIGAVVPIVNLPGVAGEIEFTPEMLAAIYLGKIKKWNDPVLRRANPRLHLPDLDIVVIHRADGSGTSYSWTDYLSKISPEWKTQVGAHMDPAWPVGRAVKGNEGVAEMVKELGGSIGYVEYIYALQNHLSLARVRNQEGRYVEAGLEGIAVAAKQAMEISDDLKVSLVNAPGAGAYPISSFSWLVVPLHIPDEGKRQALTAFLRWMLGPGQRQAAALGYLGLPPDLVSREEEAIGRIH
jgi:phosphate transport system substrate-binding protein